MNTQLSIYDGDCYSLDARKAPLAFDIVRSIIVITSMGRETPSISFLSAIELLQHNNIYVTFRQSRAFFVAVER